ncbi:gamma-glutamyl-gamma-aminobutyrate hydrolase family protein [Bacillus cereus group sp. RP32]|uniref:anthranilate synthase component II n=1 Tax=Bacillus cereus group sp. RP32 TaxID=3040258 RepID=UPI0033962583
MLLVINNYDSFTYNLVQYIGNFTTKMKVINNDKINFNEICKLNIEKILISPGPKSPSEAGQCKEVLDIFKDEIPILGVCLGHQIIGEYFGASVTFSPYVYHGKTSRVHHDGRGIFKGIKQNINVGRYHSLIVENTNFPHDQLDITAQTEDGLIMGIRHKTYDIESVQFHPESILTTNGIEMISNFVNK